MTPEQLVEASSQNGQTERNTLINLAYTVLDINPLATLDVFDDSCCQTIWNR